MWILKRQDSGRFYSRNCEFNTKSMGHARTYDTWDEVRDVLDDISSASRIGDTPTFLIDVVPVVPSGDGTRAAIRADDCPVCPN
jgi:hypothetical protein